MKCLVCGSEMRLDPIAGEESVSVSGFEHRSFRCSSCGDVEQRLVFRAERDADSLSPGPSQSSAIQSCSTDEQPAAFAAVRQPGKKVSGIYTRLKRLLPFRRESAVPSRSTAATPYERPAIKNQCRILHRGSKYRTQVVAFGAECGPGLIEADGSLDECEVLLKRAIDMVHGRDYSAETKTEMELKCEVRIEGTPGITQEPTTAPVIDFEGEIKPIGAKELEPRANKPVVV